MTDTRPHRDEYIALLRKIAEWILSDEDRADQPWATTRLTSRTSMAHLKNVPIGETVWFIGHEGLRVHGRVVEGTVGDSAQVLGLKPNHIREISGSTANGETMTARAFAGKLSRLADKWEVDNQRWDEAHPSRVHH